MGQYLLVLGGAGSAEGGKWLIHNGTESVPIPGLSLLEVKSLYFYVMCNLSCRCLLTVLSENKDSFSPEFLSPEL